MKTNMFLFLLTFLLTIQCLRAQESNALTTSAGDADPLDIAKTYIHAHLDEWGLTLKDITGMTVSDMYTDKSSGITRVYFLQHYREIPVHNAILNISITKEGKVFFAGNRFVQNLAEKVNTTTPVLNQFKAVENLADHLGLTHEVLWMKSQTAGSQFVLDKSNIAKEDIAVGLSYQTHDDQVLLAWDILLSPVGSNDKWSVRIDAITGEVIDKNNWTVYCNQEGMSVGNEHNVWSSEENACDEQHDFFHSDVIATMTGAQYNVWPAPFENPLDGPRTIVTDPFDPVASPFGWHDIDGQPGAEFTVTRGNNCYAYQDRDNLGYSSGDEPDGGPQLHFNFPFNAALEPEQYVDASVVNLFYWLNYMHDFAYHFGFDEAAGNFQKNNYGNGGLEGDPMIGVTQAAANAGYADNPFYRHGNEGSPGAVFMLVFNRNKKSLTVNEPAIVSAAYETDLAGFGWGAGAYVTEVPVTAEVAFVNDGVEELLTTDACEEILNASELAGKIAFIDRGICEYGFKAYQAQNAGAIGVIICNYNEDNLENFQPGAYGPYVNIPVVVINLSDGNLLRQYVGQGLKVTLAKSDEDGPSQLDLGLDNGFIAHEYGHGIAWRLAGGPDHVCIGNLENMDEGWSDFLALVTTVQPGDTVTRKKGIGTYLRDEPSTGRGSRRYPYSPDMNENPMTYGDAAAYQEIHAVGSVWASMLWDMYWAFTDKYGWSPDPFDESSGNYKAIRLVFDGLKNIPCHPGFVDGRDAILAADEVLYHGDDVCLIWEVFARRGLGYSAEQGSPYFLGDEKEAFDVLPVCANKLIIEKSVTDFILPGEEIGVTTTVGNFKPEVVTNIVVTDEIPEGTSFQLNSSNFPATVQGNTVSFKLGDMSFTDEKVITYTLVSDPYAWSQRKFLDAVSGVSSGNWISYSVGDDLSGEWTLTNEYPSHTGNLAWHASELPGRCWQTLELNRDIYTFHPEGDHPVLRFYHRYQTQPGIDGGIVEIREVGTSIWKSLSDAMLRNGYPGFVSLFTFGLPEFQAFSGDSGDDFQATYIDLSNWSGKDIQIRFRFGTDVNTNDGMGWLVDDIEFMDLLSYNSAVCVTSDQGDYECAIAPELGTIVDSRSEVTSATKQLKELSASIYPNPATDMITVALSGNQEHHANVSMLTMDGRLLFAKSFDINGNDLLNINTNDVPAGIYLVKVNTAEGQFIEKVIIQD